MVPERHHTVSGAYRHFLSCLQCKPQNQKTLRAGIKIREGTLWPEDEPRKSASEVGWVSGKALPFNPPAIHSQAPTSLAFSKAMRERRRQWRRAHQMLLKNVYIEVLLPLSKITKAQHMKWFNCRIQTKQLLISATVSMNNYKYFGREPP